MAAVKIYTKTGDDGQTGLLGGHRVSKDDIRIEAYGTVDEFNAFLGVARAESPPSDVDAVLAGAQNCLFSIGAELATPEPARQRTPPVTEESVRGLELAIDALEESLPPLRQFILPGGNRVVAALHAARSVCRRAERRVVTLSAGANVSLSPQTIQYLNRLSDYLFVAARYVCQVSNIAEVPWQKN
jgi:cob(I)alamin adenosyltransferase